MTLPIAVDVMGGDKAPAEIVAGCLQAAEELGIGVLLVGRPEALEGIDTGVLEVVPATEVIDMAEDPGKAVRTKKDSSLVRSAEAVRDGRASAMVSAGNTGATMASALLRTGRIKGVLRPAIVTPIPVPGSPTPTALLDAGANVEWTDATWTAEVPAATTLELSVRTGGRPRPGPEWSPWRRLPVSGAVVGGAARYLQYCAALATDDVGRTPVLRGVTFRHRDGIAG